MCACVLGFRFRTYWLSTSGLRSGTVLLEVGGAGGGVGGGRVFYLQEAESLNTLNLRHYQTRNLQTQPETSQLVSQIAIQHGLQLAR